MELNIANWNTTTINNNTKAKAKYSHPGHPSQNISDPCIAAHTQVSNGYHGMAELECPISADCSVTSQLSGCSLEVKWRPNRWGTWKVSTDVFLHILSSILFILSNFSIVFSCVLALNLVDSLKVVLQFSRKYQGNQQISHISWHYHRDNPRQIYHFLGPCKYTVIKRGNGKTRNICHL